MIISRLNDMRGTLTGALRLTEINESISKKDLVAKVKAEKYAKLINKRLLELSQIIAGNIELPSGFNFESVINEINSLGKGFGIVNSDELLANYQTIGTLVMAKTLYSFFPKLEIESTKHWLTKEGQQLNNDINEGNENYRNKCLRLILPFIEGFEGKDEMSVLFKTRVPYKRQVKATMKVLDFKEGLKTGKIKLNFFDGKEVEQTDYIYLSQISI